MGLRWRWGIWLLLVVGTVAAVAGCIFWFFYSTASAPSVAVSSALQKVKCDFSYSLNKRAACYQYSASPDGVNGQGFVLPVVVIKPKKALHSEPLVYLAGGPGSMFVSAEDSVTEWLQWSDQSGLGRDLVLYDIRGAQPGAPSWDCQAYTKASKDALKKNLTYAQEARLIAPVLHQCLLQWDSKLTQQFSKHKPRAPGWGLNLFSTRQNVLDLKGIMAALGFARWNILGESYGTRLAMAAAVELPGTVKHLILDSPYPAGFGGLDDAILVWHSAFERLFFKYRERGLKQQYDALVAKLQRQPLRVTVEDWATGEPLSWVLNEVRLAAVIYSGMYLSELYQTLPAAVSGLLSENTADAQWLLDVFYNNAFSDQFNAMIYFATECNDNSEPSRAKFEYALKVASPWAHFFSADWDFDVCRNHFFSAAPLPANNWLQPTLITSGALDPITNAGYARTTLKRANKGYLMTFPEQSHAEFVFSDCGRKMIPLVLASGEGHGFQTSLKNALSKCSDGNAFLELNEG